MSTAESVIETLNLQRHPEGGWFRETFRDGNSTTSGGRAASTMIYFLLRVNEFSQIHRIDAAEAWHFYAGQALNVVELDDSGPKVTRMGTDFANGERPQHLVNKNTWFGCSLAADSEWALVGNTVAPGFEFATFELGERQLLLQQYPQCEEWIRRLTRED